MRLPLTASLDLAGTLDAGQAFRWTFDGSRWRGVLGDTALAMTVEDGALEFNSFPTPEAAALPQVVRYLALHEDPYHGHAALRNDPYLSDAMDRFPGVRILHQDPWECLIAFICSSECSIPRIRRMMRALSATFGLPIPFKGETLYAFPSPSSLAGAGEQSLRDLGLGFRAKGVAIAAERVASGALDLESLRFLSYDDARATLIALPGVGPKIADCVLLFSLDHGLAFPIDRWVRRALLRVYSLPEKTPDRTLVTWARDRFGPHAGYAQQLLFHAERARGRNEPLAVG